LSTVNYFNNVPGAGPSTLSGTLINLLNYSSMLGINITGSNGYTAAALSNQSGGNTNYALRLIDSSSPPFSRDIQFNWAL
jgi:hypothetical protein